MAEIIHETSHQILGPFLIDRQQLESLDKILRDEWSRFEEERSRELNAAVEQELKRYPEEHKEQEEEARKRFRSELEKSRDFRARMECFLYLRDGSVAKVPDFSSAYRETELQDKSPHGFYAVLESGENSCKVMLSDDPAGLKVEVAPTGSEFVLQTLMVLKNWQNAVQPPKWQRIWSYFRFPLWMAWLFSVAISFLFLQAAAETHANGQLTQEALSLITNNVSAQNQSRAIQLLLAKSFDYHPQPIRIIYPGWFYILLLGGFIYVVALSFSPKVTVGVGRGERQVRFWRGYSKFLVITTPCFIFTTFMWPKIRHFIETHFP